MQDLPITSQVTDAARIEERLVAIETALVAIEARNARVTADKRWELSLCRRGSLTAVTYLAAAIVLRGIGAEHYLTNALVPAGGYLLSTLSLPLVRERWLRRQSDR